jgi:signal peptidase II
VPSLSPRVWAGLVAVVVFILDRASKLWIQANVGPLDTIAIIPNVFNIVYARNRGAAFGMLNTAPEWIRVTVLIGLSTAILAFICWMLWQATRPGQLASLTQRWALSLVLGGALGNLHDRILEGSVTDFIQVFFGSYEYPSFNVADSAIFVGAVLMGYELIFQKDVKKESNGVSETH